MLLNTGTGLPEQGGLVQILISMLPIILLIAVFYLMVIRPQRKKDKENREMLASLAVGDNITTIGGICGKITSIREDVVIIEVGADKVKLVFERWAIRNVDKISAD